MYYLETKDRLYPAHIKERLEKMHFELLYMPADGLYEVKRKSTIVLMTQKGIERFSLRMGGIHILGDTITIDPYKMQEDDQG